MARTSTVGTRRTRNDAERRPPVISAEASNKVINDKIKTLRKTMVKTDEDIQDIIVLGVTHSMGVGNGDVTWCGRLIDAIPKTYRRSLVINYINQCTIIRVRKDAKTNTFKASVKDEAAIDKQNKDNLELNVKRKAAGLNEVEPLSWEQTFKFVGEKGDDEDEPSTFQKYLNPFFTEMDVDREPGIFTLVDADSGITAMADRIKNRISKGQVQKADVPMLRALETQLRQVHSDFKADKLRPIMDDNTIGEVGSRQAA